MRTLPAFAIVLVALAASGANEKIAAPVPKEPEPKFSIEGKYNLLAVSLATDRMGPAGFGGAGGGFPGGGGGGGTAGGGPMGRSVNSVVLVGPATITKNEITLEGNGRVSPLAANNVPTTMEYTIDTTKTPAFINVEITNIRGKKSKSLGVVEVHNNRLTVALAKEGDERPKTTEEAEGVTVYYFQKAPHHEYRIIAMTAGKEETIEKELNKLALEGFELESTTQPSAVDGKSSVTVVHFILKRTVK
jgi:hypothetical protein